MENNTQCFLPKTSPCCFEQFADNSGKVDFCVVFSLVTSRSWSAPVKSHMVQKINKVYFFFLCWPWSELWASEFFVQNSWKFCFPWALLGLFPLWAVSKSCFYFRVETRPSETSFWCWGIQLPGTTGRKVPNLRVCINAIWKSVRSSH